MGYLNLNDIFGYNTNTIFNMISDTRQSLHNMAESIRRKDAERNPTADNTTTSKTDEYLKDWSKF